MLLSFKNNFIYILLVTGIFVKNVYAPDMKTVRLENGPSDVIDFDQDQALEYGEASNQNVLASDQDQESLEYGESSNQNAAASGSGTHDNLFESFANMSVSNQEDNENDVEESTPSDIYDRNTWYDKPYKQPVLANIKKFTAMKSYAFSKDNPELDPTVCAHKIKTFLRKCETCSTYLDWIKYALLNLVFTEISESCVFRYIDYMSNAITQTRDGYDDIRVRSPATFCSSLVDQHVLWNSFVGIQQRLLRDECKRQMNMYFKDALKDKDSVIHTMYYFIDITQIQNLNYLTQYMEHVKNTFYYNRDKLSVGENPLSFCESDLLILQVLRNTSKRIIRH